MGDVNHVIACYFDDESTAGLPRWQRSRRCNDRQGQGFLQVSCVDLPGARVAESWAWHWQQSYFSEAAGPSGMKQILE